MTKKQKKLKQFLESKASHGVPDSQGQFTLSSEEAFHKLSHLCLEDTEDWILKVVQATVAGGGTKLSLKHSRRALTVDIHGLAELPTLQEIERAIFSPELPTSPFLSELVVGLRTLMSFASLGIGIGGEECLFWEGGKMGHYQSRDAGPGLRIWVPTRKWSIGTAKKSLAQIDLLSRRAMCAPIRLLVDSKPLLPDNTLGLSLWHSDGLYSGTDRSAPLLYSRFEPTVSLEALKEAVEIKGQRFLSDRVKTAGFLVKSFLRNGPRSSNFHYYAWARFYEMEMKDQEGNSSRPREVCPGFFELQFTRLGVVCGRIAVDAPLNATLQFPADDLQGDLSGLSLNRVRLSRKQVLPIIERLECLNQTLIAALWDSPGRVHIDRHDIKRGVTGGAAAMIGIGLGFPLGGAKIAGTLAIGASMGVPLGFLGLYRDNFEIPEERIQSLPAALEELPKAIKKLFTRLQHETELLPPRPAV